MQRKVVTTIDLVAIGFVGAVGGQRWCARAIAYPDVDPLEIGSAIGAAVTVLIALDLLKVEQSPERQGLGPKLTRVLSAFFGAILGARSFRFLWDWDHIHLYLHFLSLAFFIGLVLTYGLVCFLKWREASRGPDGRPPALAIVPILYRVALPACALALLVFLVGTPSVPAAFAAGLGAVLGVAWFSRFCLWGEPEDSALRQLTRFDRAAGLMICAGIVVVARYGYMVLPDQVLRRVVTGIGMASLAAIGGTVLCAAMAGRLGTGAEDRVGLAKWLCFCGPRSLLFLLMVGVGAVVGDFAVGVIWLQLPGVPYPKANPGALIGGTVAVLLASNLKAGGLACGRAVLEAVDLGLGFLRIAVPVGLAIFVVLAVFVDHFQSGYLVLIALVYGPLVGGTLGLIWRAHRLYHPLSRQEWTALAWGWAVLGAFALKQQSTLMDVFRLDKVIPSTFLIAPIFLMLLALLELLGKEARADGSEDG